jgi:transcriptional regulatory protein RtcR
VIRKRVIFGLLGTTLDVGRGPARWDRWRPTVSLAQHEDLAVDRFEILYPRIGTNLAKQVADDIARVSPGTQVRLHLCDPRDPWDFEQVYTALHDFAIAYPFDLEREEFLVDITTGTHVAQICLFLLTETRRFPGKLIQTGPARGDAKASTRSDPVGEYRIIDLDLSKYDRIAARVRRELTDNIAGLKSGIRTRNAAFNRLIEQIEHVAAHSADPILLMGPAGAGKSQLARRVYELRKNRRLVEGAFVEINCATLRGDAAMSALFGHRKGAFTGAAGDRPGLLRAAHAGVLFLDEIGELGLDEQAMLLRALEEKRFLPLGSDEEVTSEFQLIAGTNRDLRSRVAQGIFRDDLLARIDMWTYRLPALRERREDIEPNIEYELAQVAARTGRAVRFSTEARDAYLAFANAPGSLWTGNFRDLSASISRMATLSPSGRITEDVVAIELQRLRESWHGRPIPTDSPAVTAPSASPAHRFASRGDLSGSARDSARGRSADLDDASAEIDGRDGWFAINRARDLIAEVIGGEAADELDRFDLVQLADVIAVCRRSRSLSDAGRTLFAASRSRRTSVNDADRIRKYLARFGISGPEALHGPS